MNTFVGEFKRTLVNSYTRRQGSESLFGGVRTIGKRHDIDAEILAHYEEGIEKERLLGEGAGRLEYLRTRELLARYLPPPAAEVLDVGGGAGAYALPLAKEGYSVNLVDPVPLHVEQAAAASAAQTEAPLVGLEVGDARSLSQEDENVDAVLLLGPLYHLTLRDDRIRALREAWRVVRPGGVVVVAAISRFASTIDGLLRGFLLDPEFEAIVERDVRDGQHRNPTEQPEWFTTAYFHLPEELRSEAKEAGFAVERSARRHRGTGLGRIRPCCMARRPEATREAPRYHPARGGRTQLDRCERSPARGR